jgi:hypothetical protein
MRMADEQNPAGVAATHHPRAPKRTFHKNQNEMRYAARAAERESA